MGFAEDLTAQPTADEPRYQPKVEFGPSGTGRVTSGLLREVPNSSQEIIEQFGLGDQWVAHSEPRIKRMWKAPGVEQPGFVVDLDIRMKRDDPDLEELFSKAAEWRAPRLPEAEDNSVAVWQVSDTQIGKVDGDGVEGTLRRVYASRDRFVDRLKLDRPASALLVFAGDCLEGNQSQGGRNMWRTTLTITEQVRVWRRLLFDLVTSIAPYASELVVAVVNGNHDEAQRNPVSTRPDDGWATEGAIAVADAIEGRAWFDHVRIVVPERDKGYMTIRVQDSTFAILHGHQFRKGKAREWWESQAFYQDNSAGADFMLHGHWHSTSMSQDGPRTIMCSGTYDGGSNWYRDSTGAVARQGGLAYLTQGSEFYGLERI